jgi:hypothetical protein
VGKRGDGLVARSLALAVVAAAVPSVVLLGGRAAALAPTPVFAPYVNYHVGVGRGVAIGDFTGDGRNDVLLTTEDDSASENPTNDRLWLFIQNADGRFGATQSWPLALGWMPEASVAAGDLNGDGRTDAVVATGTTLQPFLQQNGTLSPGSPVALEGVQQVEVADVGRDGAADLVVNGTGGVAVLHGAGNGTFASPMTVTVQPSMEVEVADVTGDSRPDVVTCGLPDVRVFAQLAAGIFAPPVSLTGEVACQGLALGDVTGDGRNDVAIAGGGNRPTGRLNVWPQTASGTAGAMATYASHDLPGSLERGDVNGDGRTDLVVLHENWMTVGVYAQAPDRTLDPERRYPIPYANHPDPKALEVGDVNGDSRSDIVIADDQHGLVVLWGQPAAPSTTTSTSLLPTTTSTTVPPGSPLPLFEAKQPAPSTATGRAISSCAPAMGSTSSCNATVASPIGNTSSCRLPSGWTSPTSTATARPIW